MKPEPTTRERIDKLPEWAQKHIEKLLRERAEAVNTLNAFVDQQTPTQISFTQHPCTGEQAGPSQKKRYIHAREVQFRHAGVRLDVYLTQKDDHQRSFGIELSWSAIDERVNHLPMIVSAFGRVTLVTKENVT